MDFADITTLLAPLSDAFRLMGNEIGDAGGTALAEALKCNNTLTTIM